MGETPKRHKLWLCPVHSVKGQTSSTHRWRHSPPNLCAHSSQESSLSLALHSPMPSLLQRKRNWWYQVTCSVLVSWEVAESGATQVPVSTLFSSLSSIPNSSARSSDFTQFVLSGVHQGLRRRGDWQTEAGLDLPSASFPFLYHPALAESQAVAKAGVSHCSLGPAGQAGKGWDTPLEGRCLQGTQQ